MKRSRSTLLVAVLSVLALVTAACGDDDDDTSAPAEEGSESGSGDAELDQLISAAQEEGSLVWYSVPAEPIAQAVSDAFSEEYDITVEFQRLASADLAQRYAAEASADSTVADAVVVSNTPFVAEAFDEGWTTPLADVVPGFPGDYPEEFILDDRGTAIVSIEPTGIAYNTDQVAEDEAPQDWAELADPEWEDKILLVDPAGSPAYVDFWTVVMEAEGEEVLSGIAENVIRTYPSGVPAVEALNAGEGAIVVPSTGSIVAGAADRGAPVAFTQPEVTTGPEIVALVSADAPHPNAAALFAWYLMFGEGQEILNELPTTASPATGEDLPEGYTRTPPDAQENRDQIYSLLAVS